MRTMNPGTVVVMLIMTASPAGPLLAGTDVQAGKVGSGGGPIVGSTVTLYSTGPEKGSGAISLGTSQSGPGGRFRISYTAPSNDDAVLYLIADGPEDGVRLATVLGTGGFPDRVTINERTTVATAHAMAQYIVGDNIGGKSPGVQNAAAILRNLVDLKTGKIGHVLRTPPNGNRTSTMRAFNSLANMLAGCVSGDADCLPLFLLATPPGGDIPDNTLQAAVNIAHHSWQNNAALYVVSMMFEHYHPTLQNPPVTWTLALKFVGNGHEFDGPGRVAFDADGNAWSNQNYTFHQNHSQPACDSKILSRLTPTGEVFPGAPYTGGGLSGAGFGCAIDPNGDIWVGNFGFFGLTCPCDLIPAANSVSRFSSDGVPLSPPGGFTQGCITAAQATIPDQAGNIWIANQCGGTITLYRNGNPEDYWIYFIADDQLCNPPEPCPPCPPFSGTGPKPFAIAVDGDGNAWISNNAGDNALASVFQLSPDGVLLKTVGADPDPEVGVDRPMGVTVDSVGNVWVSNSAIVTLPCAACDFFEDYGTLDGKDEGFFSVMKLDSEGNQVGLLKDGGLFIPWGLAVDGNDDIWVANFASYRVSHFSGATGEPIAPDGYHSDALQRNTGISIDPSGNVWLTNNWLPVPVPTNPGGDGLVMFIGLAAPVKTPLIGPVQQP